MQAQTLQRIDVTEAKRLYDQGEVVFLDTRSDDAWGRSDVQIPNAIRVPPDDVAHHLDEIPGTGTLITYCT